MFPRRLRKAAATAGFGLGIGQIGQTGRKTVSIYPVVITFRKLQAGYKRGRMGTLEIERALQPLWVFLGETGCISEYESSQKAMSRNGGKDGKQY